MKPLIIGIAGGSGSGKTTFAKRVRDALGPKKCAILYQDSYYIDQSARFDHDGGSVNFDHPNAIDFPLMAEHLKELSEGKDIKVPHYDFATHTRSEDWTSFESKPIILLDGILILSQGNVCAQLGEAYFIDVPDDIRFERRLKRDVEERGRSPEGVQEQYEKQVRPMHDQFVGPSKNNASHVVSMEEFDSSCLELVSRLQRR